MGAKLETFNIANIPSDFATLGDVAASVGVMPTGYPIDAVVDDKDVAFKSEHFDKFVKEDLIQLKREGKLKPKANPFPTVEYVQEHVIEDKRFFWQKHRVLCGIIAAIAIASVVGIALLIVAAAALYIYSKVYKDPKPEVNEDVKCQLARAGHDYWETREQVRTSLDSGKLSELDAYKKLLSNSLVRSFPENIDYLEKQSMS